MVDRGLVRFGSPPEMGWFLARLDSLCGNVSQVGQEVRGEERVERRIRDAREVVTSRCLPGCAIGLDRLGPMAGRGDQRGASLDGPDDDGNGELRVRGAPLAVFACSAAYGVGASLHGEVRPWRVGRLVGGEFFAVRGPLKGVIAVVQITSCGSGVVIRAGV